MLTRSFSHATILFAALAVGCGDDPPGSTGAQGGGGQGGGASTVTSGGGGGQGGGGGGGGAPTCIKAEGPGAMGTDSWMDTPHEAKVTVGDRDSCTRTYTLSTTGPLRDEKPGNPRTIKELEGQPILRSGHDMFDALYALALEETRECSVDAISDWAFNSGNPLPCAAGGCFETGRLWKYVWTRDTAYATALGLATLDPTRSKNSLEFKTSARRSGADTQIVQDTGTGGSYPISTDRVVWAIGAWETLKWLDGAERTAFRDLAFESMRNTSEHDRMVAFDPADGLYRGEQSFLDWREQSYPAWTAGDVVHIGMSKSLSTNVGHYVLLDSLARLSTEKGDSAGSAKYAGWASALREAIREKLWLPEEGAFSAFSTTYLDESPTRQLDLLGSSLAVLHGVATTEQAASIVATYPHLPKGPPVLYPQQKDVPIYHNRGIWPFVTAFWARAAATVGHAEALDNAWHSLVRGAALNLSNMENFEVVSGANWFEDGGNSGPTVNSQRQLWSVAGYVSLVHDIVFGLTATQDGIAFSPKITRKMRRNLFAGADSIALDHLPWRGRKLSIVVRLPATVGEGDGLLEVTGVKVNGATASTGPLGTAELPAGSHLIEVTLAEGAASKPPFRLITEADAADYKNLFGPRSPIVTGLAIVGDRIQVSFGNSGEVPAEVAFHVYRDGARVAENLPGSTTAWTDPDSGDHATRTHCYSVEATFVGSGNASQHASPACYWGAGDARIQSFPAAQFVAVGGAYVNNHGRFHYEGWGDPGHTLTVTNIVAGTTGPHLFQVTAGNGGGISTGITCAVKALEVWDGATLVASGQLTMPHAGDWANWRDSSFVRADLESGKSYTVVIRENDYSGNMSSFEHFSLYEGTGGKGGAYNRVNIAELKLLSLGAP